MQIFTLLTELIESLIATITSTLRQFIIAPSLGYIRWLTTFVWIPEIIDATIYREIFTNHWRIFPAMAIVVTAIAIPWDYFTIKDSVWYFPGSIVGIWLFGIPLEEYLWFIFVAWIIVLILLFFSKVKERGDVQ